MYGDGCLFIREKQKKTVDIVCHRENGLLNRYIINVIYI